MVLGLVTVLRTQGVESRVATTRRGFLNAATTFDVLVEAGAPR